MSATVLWTLLGLLLLGAIAWLIARIAATAMGPYSTRLLAVGATLIGYYGGLSLSRHAPILFHPVHLRVLQFAVPVAGMLALFYCGWRIVQNWRSELQGLLGCLYKLALVLLLAALARFCFSI
jgi:hypothetical protein